MSLSFLFFFSLFSSLALPGYLYAGTDLPRQDINISFDPAQAKMTGHSVVTVPPDTPLQLYLDKLENVTVLSRQDDSQRKLQADDKNILTLPAQAAEQTVELSWQLTTTTGGHSLGNLISPDGITLTGFWHPVSDGDMLYSLTAVLPEGFSGVSEGEKLSLAAQKGKRVLKASSSQPLQSINFAAGPYRVSSLRVGKTSVFTYFFKEDAGLSAGYLNKAAEYIRHYEKLIGPFPYPRYSIVENRLPTGYGMPTFTLLGQAVVRLPFIKDTSLGHEILHSWFGNAVRTDSTGNWCEGLTTYLADQWYAADRGEGSRYRKDQLMRYASYVHSNNITALIDFQHGGDSQPMARKMRAIGYDKGSMFFHMLRREIGDGAFFKALKKLSTDFRYKKIGWTDLELLFSSSADRNLSPFFGQWLLRNDIPNLSVTEAVIEQKNGQSQLSFHLVQDNVAPYRLQVPVVVKTLQGETREIVPVDSPDQQVTVTTDNLPTQLLIDPEYDLMRGLQEDEHSPTWTQFMGADQKTVVLPPTDKLERYLPLVAGLERMGCTLITAEELKNSTLDQGSFLFLGSSAHTRGLFGKFEHPERGFALDVRKNPLNPEQVMVLVFSSSTEETSRVVRKLSHYGKYSFLRFSGGRVSQKETTSSADGIQRHLLAPPDGIPVQRVKDFSAIIDDISRSDVVYIGEMHTDYGSHLLQLQIIQVLYEKNPNLAIGMEMFPRTSQQALDNYINGTITDEKDFLKQSNYFKVWGYDYRMYRYIIGYAEKNRIPLVGLNLDKEIVSTVFSKGSTDELSKEQIARVAAERDLDLPGYRKRLTTVHALHDNAPHGSNFNGFLQAQSMWDETMAESIVNYLQAHPDKQMVVIAGTGHVYKDSAIPPRVSRRMKVSQSVLIADNGMDRGMEEGKKLDYLMFAKSIDLSPAGKIGVMLEEIKKTDDTPAHLKIIQISPHGKGKEAGLKDNDIIEAVDDYPVVTIGDLKAGLLDREPGDSVVLKIARGDKTLDIEVELSNMEMSSMMMPPGHPEKK